MNNTKETFTIPTLEFPTMMSIRAIAKTGVLPENAIRTMVKNGSIQVVHSGTKVLINFKLLCEYLNSLTVNTNNGGKEDA